MMLYSMPRLSASFTHIFVEYDLQQESFLSVFLEECKTYSLSLLLRLQDKQPSSCVSAFIAAASNLKTESLLVGLFTARVLLVDV